ncbi:MAG TPA: cysteine desulfurase family protein [Candidatus Methanoperedens sp.]|nr:cysteine desulfurase family protein [Candidatus Methanoperedens sp.]
MKPVYLDHNATTPVRPEVIEAMLPMFREDFGNPSSAHACGGGPRRLREEARAKVAALLGCCPVEVVFTSGGTESDNHAIKGAAFALRERGTHIVASRVEHHAVLHSCRWLERRLGFTVTHVGVDADGRVDPGAVAAAITPATVLVSIMAANNESGTVNPVAEIGRVCRERGVLFHTDAVQAVGKIPIDVKALGADFLSLSGHKIYGPKGVGALYIREGVTIDPLIHGGGHEIGRRAGTEHTSGIVGLGRAAELARLELGAEARQLAALRDDLWARIREQIPDVRLNGHPTERLPNTLNVSFPRLEAESALMLLDREGIAVSTGSACSSEDQEASHVLTAMGRTPLEARGAIRFSLGRDNTPADIDRLMAHLPGIIGKLRAMSPL